MVHDDRFETRDGSEKFVTTFRKVHSSNCSRNLQICPKIVCPLVQKLGNKGPKSGGEKKTTNFAHFSKGCVFFWPVPLKDVREVGETVGGIAAAGWAWQQQGGYGLVGLVPRYRMVCFGSHVTPAETGGVDKLFPDKCRQNTGKSEYFSPLLAHACTQVYRLSRYIVTVLFP